MSLAMLAISAMGALLHGLPSEDAQTPPPAAAAEVPATRFESVDVYVDAGETPLAAYQVRLSAVTPDSPNAAVLVGIEGGDAGVFEVPPYYDPKALATNRIVVAAYSLAATLPVGRTRVARLHLQLGASQLVQYECKLEVAGDAAANSIQATVEVIPTGKRADARNVAPPSAKADKPANGKDSNPTPSTEQHK